MKNRIELLVSLGLTQKQAEDFCRDIYYEGSAATSHKNVEFREDYDVVPFSSLLD